MSVLEASLVWHIANPHLTVEVTGEHVSAGMAGQIHPKALCSMMVVYKRVIRHPDPND